MSTRCNHAERWPDGFCLRCAEVEEQRRREVLSRKRLEALLDADVLELFPAVRFINCGGYLCKDSNERQ